MSASIAVTYASQLTVAETLGVNVPFAQAATILHNGMDVANLKLASATTPAVSKVAAFIQALTAGVATIDLTNLLGTNGAAVTGNGLRVQLLKVQNPITNTHPLTIAPGASNGLHLFGAGSLIELLPGEEFLYKSVGTGPLIGGSAKTLDLTDASAAGAESHNFLIILG